MARSADRDDVRSSPELDRLARERSAHPARLGRLRRFGAPGVKVWPVVIERFRMLADILLRVERRLELLQLTAHAASARAGSPDAIRNLRRAVLEGRRGVSTATLTALAPVLQTTAAWLMDGQGAETAPAETMVVGYVTRGSSIVFLDDAAGEALWPGAPGEGRRAALEIRGCALGPGLHDALVVYEPPHGGVRSAEHDRLCVVRLSERAGILATVRPRSLERYDLVPAAPEALLLSDQAPIWAARVRSVQLR